MNLPSRDMWCRKSSTPSEGHPLLYTKTFTWELFITCPRWKQLQLVLMTIVSRSSWEPFRYVFVSGGKGSLEKSEETMWSHQDRKWFFLLECLTGGCQMHGGPQKREHCLHADNNLQDIPLKPLPDVLPERRRPLHYKYMGRLSLSGSTSTSNV